MKKILLTSIAVAACGIRAFGSGIILFENVDGSSFVTLNSLTGPATGSGLVVDLFWQNGSSFQLEDTFTSTFTGIGSGNPFQMPGEFNAGGVVIPQTGTQTFEVEGFYTSGGTPYSGTTGSFVASVNSGFPPPVTIDAAGGAGGSWDGNLVLNPVPEPTTITLGGLGAAALWLFRRRRLH